MISIIVPVYNVEPYLRKCLDSIVGQSYRDLEILVIDDGSTDCSGKICDEYAERDERIKVFHTENRGLSCARNLGLDEATGEWIGFVDSDDWIEPDMYEVLLKKAEETGADVVECAVLTEHNGITQKNYRKDIVMSGEDAINLLIREKISNAVWNKIWKRQCYECVRFPEGRIFEEHATTYKVYLSVKNLCTVSSAKYHYQKREGSLSQTHDIKNLMDCWLSYKERKEALWNQVDDDGKKELLRLCATAVARVWAYICDCTEMDRKKNAILIQEMKLFTCQYIPIFGFYEWSTSLRVGILFPHFCSRLSMRVAWIVNRFNKRIQA